ncbi:cystathionine gamma-synthase-like protein [Lindgomyces ingoldianus]|uniref:Cystathionine gamma-synthase-like protein n=1 Tax=Lindgomyces ingoldianus TaxID=673940 RepID=A0ACB6QI67_9PLEO|nr:cystathionine gamma-synthase-like protein [Lindgomyces ingoldianus]KAF2466724.1 cystathionine gamma-synthase-like protein [Lindgomyces ingoldianus]
MAFENDVEVGETIPSMTAHAVSVSLPTWRANVGYEEGEEWVLSKMKTGYPRFFIHKSIEKFATAIVKKYGEAGARAIIFPSHAAASRCLEFFFHQDPELEPQQVRILDLVPAAKKARSEECAIISPKISAILFPQEKFKIAKTYWQHSGDGISSRRAEYCHALFDEGVLVDSATIQESARFCKGPRRYQKKTSIDLSNISDRLDSAAEQDPTQFVEERFGRNLDISMTSNAKLAVRRRIAGSLTADVGLTEALALEKDLERTRKVAGFSEDDVYLYACGMNAIFMTHQSLMAAKGLLKSVVFGFPYIDTLKVTQKFGPGCLFYGFGSSEELDDLERRLKDGERYLALFTEFPGNPLLRSPDLERIHSLADKYDFFVVVDETVGNFLNVHVLPYADVVVSSLTKVFSGDSNVMGGSAILNPKGRSYNILKRTWENNFEDNHWAEDSIFLERNSRDFVSRIERINVNAEAICDVLRAHPRVKQVNYPKFSDTRPFYDKCRTPNGGYGGLLSATFFSKEDSVAFFDNLDTAKGPSLGTNFTLSSPYVILAHYGELDWCASYGVEANLVRFSVGLEEPCKLVNIFRHALEAIPR